MSELDTIYRCTPRQIFKNVCQIIEAGLVPFIKGSPGIGKSTIMRNVARTYGLHLIDHRASTSAPEDFTGLPEFYTNANGERRAHFVPFDDLFPIVGTPPMPNSNGWLLFLDEFNSAPKSIQAASYKLVLDRQVGQHKLEDNVAIAMAGNLDTDGAITTQMSTAMKSRVVTLQMQVDFTEWEEDVAFPQNYDHRVLAWLYNDKSALMDFDGRSVEDTFSCPRTIEFLDRLVRPKAAIVDEDAQLFAGTIGAGRAATFVQFAKVYGHIPTLAEILNDPDNARIPTDTAQRFATLGMLTKDIDPRHLNKLVTYIDRYPLDPRVMFYRMLTHKTPEFASHPDFRRGVIAISKYLNPDRVAEIKKAA